MARNSTRQDTAVETFQNYSDMTEREAEVYVLRELRGAGRKETAKQLDDISESTVDTLHQRAKDKAEFPHIDGVRRRFGSNTLPELGAAYEIVFENGAKLRYVWNDELGHIKEEVFTANDPDSVYKSFDVGGSEDELAEYALQSIEQYTQLRDDVDALEGDWPPLYEALTGYGSNANL